VLRCHPLPRVMTIPLRLSASARHRRRSMIRQKPGPGGFSLRRKHVRGSRRLHPRFTSVRDKSCAADSSNAAFRYLSREPSHDRAGSTSFFDPTTLLGFGCPSQYSLINGSGRLHDPRLDHSCLRVIRIRPPVIPTCHYEWFKPRLFLRVSSVMSGLLPKSLVEAERQAEPLHSASGF
jgi:hypothetical protein